MEAGREALAVGLALVMVTVPAVPTLGADRSTPAEPALEATEPPVVSEPVPRGGVEPAGPAVTEPVHPKTVDGQVDDWIGQATDLAGTAVTDHGERIWQGFLFDDFGADDGRDAERLQLASPGYDREDRLERIEAATQAADEQFGAPQAADGRLVTPPNYGDATYPDDAEGQADLTEVRVSADAENVYLLARFATLTNASDPALFVLADRGQETDQPPAHPGFGSGLEVSQASKPLYVDATGVYEAIDRPAPAGWETAAVDGASVAVEPAGSTNAIEVQIPRSTLEGPGDSKLSLFLASGVADTGPDGDPQLADVAAGEADVDLLDVAFRQEPAVSNWFDRGQALNLLRGHVEPYLEPVDLDALAAGASRPVQPTPGYHSVVFESSANISSETTEQGPKETILQPYGLYLPSDWEEGDGRPLTTWLHYRGGTTHQTAAWLPRAVEQLGEDRDPGNVMVFPRGRGTATWYAGAAHLDVLQVLEDVQERFEVDEDRRYLAGYSMGGYGSYLFGLLYPDRFAAAYPVSGAMTIGLWAGVFEDGRDTMGENGGDGNLENTYRLVENARNLPYVIHHGTDDELVPITGVQRMAAKFADLGYQYRFYRFLGYEHFSQAAVDQWTEGASYLDDQTRPDHPARVVYKRVPALEHAIETLNARGAQVDLNTDGAYWVSNLTLRETSTTDPSVHGQVDAVTHAVPDDHVETPEAGAASPGHSTPYAMTGLDWTSIACAPELVCPLTEPPENRLEVDLTNLASANVSADGAQLETRNVPAELTLTTDGPTTLHVEGDWECQEGETLVHADGPAPPPTIGDDAITLRTDGEAQVTVRHCVTVD